MANELIDTVREAFEQGRAIDDVRTELVSQGFLEDEVIDVIQKIKGAERTMDE